MIWKSSPIALGNNFSLTKRQLDYLKKDFANNKWLEAEYGIIKDQLDTGIIENCDRDINEYFMTHRAVIRKDKDMTRVCIVFNCSSKSKEEISLNYCLETGPNLNTNILDVILNFRKFKVAFTADIEKAFLMIGIAEEELKFLKFFWIVDEKNEDFKIMRMTRLPFGCRTSFVLSATISIYCDISNNCV